jgi:hypothetical protein
MGNVFLLADETARFVGGIQLNARKGCVDAHASACFGVEYASGTLQALAYSVKAVVEIIPTALLDKGCVGRNVLPDLLITDEAIGGIFNIHYFAVGDKLFVNGGDLLCVNHQILM